MKAIVFAEFRGRNWNLCFLLWRLLGVLTDLVPKILQQFGTVTSTVTSDWIKFL